MSENGLANEQTDWVARVETLYESFKAGESVTLPGFGGFSVRPKPASWRV